MSAVLLRLMWCAPRMSTSRRVGDIAFMQRSVPRVFILLRRLGGPGYPSSHRLVCCRHCGSDFVNPVCWHEQGETLWWIRLRCGECGLVRDVVVHNDQAEQFDHELDLGVQAIAASLERLDRERMSADADVLAAALQRDLIGPDDFAC